MIVVGIDPAMRAFGLVEVEYHFVSPEIFEREIISASVFQTTKGEFDAMASFDNAKRGGFVGRRVSEFLKGMAVRPSLVVIEAPGGARNAGTCLKLGVAIGAVMAIVEAEALPFVLLTPQCLKTRVTGSPKASKAQVAEGVRESGMNGCANVSSIRPEGIQEHAWDAAGAVIAAEEDSLFRHIAQVAA